MNRREGGTVSRRMKALVLALALVFVPMTACGGASIAGDLFSDAGHGSGPPIGEPALDAGDVGDATDASSIDAAKDSPACASQPPVAVDRGNCGTTGAWSSPAQFCLLETGATGSGYTLQDTPAACASWCTYTCACLIAAGVCPGTVASCTDRIGAVQADAVTCRP